MYINTKPVGIDSMTKGFLAVLVIPDEKISSIVDDTYVDEGGWVVQDRLGNNINVNNHVFAFPDVQNNNTNQLTQAVANNITHLILICHGISASGFTKVRVGKAEDLLKQVNAATLATNLTSAGIHWHLLEKIEILGCRTASGANTFAPLFYTEICNRGFRGRMKAPKGNLIIDSNGQTRVSYWGPLDMMEGRASLWDLTRSFSSTLLLHSDWVYFPTNSGPW